MINVAQFRCIHRKAGREVLDAAVAAPDDHLSFNTERDSKVVRPALSVQNPPHAVLSALSTRELHEGSSSLSIFFVQHVNRSHQDSQSNLPGATFLISFHSVGRLGKLIRINLRQQQVPSGHIGLPFSAADGIRRILSLRRNRVKQEAEQHFCSGDD